MCTIGAVHLKDSSILFKNLDPRRGTPFEAWVEKIYCNNNEILVVKNSLGCYGGINCYGVAIVGTFINIHKNQNNYFDNDNLVQLLALGQINDVCEYLKKNEKLLYGNILLASPEKIYSFELAGEHIHCERTTRSVMTNHFKCLPFDLQTKNDKFIMDWTTKRLARAEEIIPTVSSIETAKIFLSDHENFPDFSICNHGAIQTAASFIFDCKSKKLYYNSGSACLNNYNIYQL